MKEGQSGWVLQAVISRASFRRIPRLQEQVDMVAGDFDGAAWRRQSDSDPRPLSIIDGAFANTCSPIPLVPTLLGGPGGRSGEWSDVCGFFKPPGCSNDLQFRMHGAFTTPFDMLGIRHQAHRSMLPSRSLGPPPPR